MPRRRYGVPRLMNTFRRFCAECDAAAGCCCTHCSLLLWMLPPPQSLQPMPPPTVSTAAGPLPSTVAAICCCRHVRCQLRRPRPPPPRHRRFRLRCCNRCRLGYRAATAAFAVSLCRGCCRRHLCCCHVAAIAIASSSAAAATLRPLPPPPQNRPHMNMPLSPLSSRGPARSRRPAQKLPFVFAAVVVVATACCRRIRCRRCAESAAHHRGPFLPSPRAVAEGRRQYTP